MNRKAGSYAAVALKKTVTAMTVTMTTFEVAAMMRALTVDINVSKVLLEAKVARLTMMT